MNNKISLSEEGKLKVKWEDTEIPINSNLFLENLLMNSKLAEMQKHINNLGNEIKKIKENKINTIEDSLKDLWENEYDDRWRIN